MGLASDPGWKLPVWLLRLGEGVRKVFQVLPRLQDPNL
jgi:hypothetical protein